jgi:hypothetical protein
VVVIDHGRLGGKTCCSVAHGSEGPFSRGPVAETEEIGDFLFFEFFGFF